MLDGVDDFHVVVELLAAALTRSPLALEAAVADPDWYGPTRNGQLLLALDAIPCFLRVLNWMTVWSTLGTLSLATLCGSNP